MLIADTRVDWFRVIVDMERAGLTQQAIADRARCGKGSIHALKVGISAQPVFGNGVRLLALWMECTGRDSTSIPRLI